MGYLDPLTLDACVYRATGTHNPPTCIEADVIDDYPQGKSRVGRVRVCPLCVKRKLAREATAIILSVMLEEPFHERTAALPSLT